MADLIYLHVSSDLWLAASQLARFPIRCNWPHIAFNSVTFSPHRPKRNASCMLNCSWARHPAHIDPADRSYSCVHSKSWYARGWIAYLSQTDVVFRLAGPSQWTWTTHHLLWPRRSGRFVGGGAIECDFPQLPWAGRGRTFAQLWFTMQTLDRPRLFDEKRGLYEYKSTQESICVPSRLMLSASPGCLPAVQDNTTGGFCVCWWTTLLPRLGSRILVCPNAHPYCVPWLSGCVCRRLGMG